MKKSIAKLRCWTLLVCLAGLIGCREKPKAVHVTSIELPDSQVTSAELKTCPFGHSALKDIPIVYGLGAGTQSQEDGSEVWPGGCILGSETNKVVCTKCRYAYEPMFDTWEKNAGETGDFMLPVAKFVSDVPYTEGRLSQSVRGTEVVSDELRYRQAISLADSDKIAQAYTKKIEHSFDRSNRDMGERQTVRYRSEYESHFHLIELIYVNEQKSTYVTVIRSSEKPYGYDQ